MSNTDIRNRAWEIMKASLVPLGMLYLIDIGCDVLADEIDNLAIIILLGIVAVVVNVGSYYMLMRGWIEGQMNISHLLVPFKSKVYSGKILPVILMELLIIGLAGVPLIALLIKSMNDPFGLYGNFVILLLFLILLLVVGVAISLDWYIFVLEPELKVAEIFRRSASYMSRHWWGQFVFRFSIMLVPTIIAVVLMEFMDESLVKLLMIPAEMYIGVAGVGYVYESILMVEKNKEAATATPEPVAAIEQAEQLPPVQESIEEITERLTEEAGKDIELQLPTVETETDNTEEQ